MSKEYLLGELEKKISDNVYYQTAKIEIKKKVINETSDLLNKLKDYSLDEKEKKEISKALKFIKWMREHLK